MSLKLQNFAHYDQFKLKHQISELESKKHKK